MAGVRIVHHLDYHCDLLILLARYVRNSACTSKSTDLRSIYTTTRKAQNSSTHNADIQAYNTAAHGPAANRAMIAKSYRLQSPRHIRTSIMYHTSRCQWTRHGAHHVTIRDLATPKIAFIHVVVESVATTSMVLVDIVFNQPASIGRRLPLRCLSLTPNTKHLLGNHADGARSDPYDTTTPIWHQCRPAQVLFQCSYPART